MKRESCTWLAEPGSINRTDLMLSAANTPKQKITHNHHGYTSSQNLTQISSSINAAIQDLTARVTVTQEFHNTSESPQEITYIYSLPERATVSSFHADVDGRIVRGVIAPKKKAEERYNDALASGRNAYLSQQVSSGQFKCSVGSLAAGKKVKLVFTYVMELSFTDNMIDFTLPPHTNTSHEVLFAASLSTTSPVLKVHNSTPSGSIPPNHEFHLIITVKDVFGPIGSVEIEPEGSAVAAFQFHPDMTEAEDDEEVNCEVIFLIDCSGSMSGDPMRSVNSTMSLLLRGLPPTCHFNIIDFGSGSRSLFESSVPYNKENFDKAMEANKRRSADMGGTELYQPLQKILKREPLEGMSRQIFLLTDGEVDRSEECIRLAERDSHLTRIFTFGIGSGVDRNLVTQIAKKSNGRCEMINSSNMEEAVMRQMNHALKPALTELRMEWAGWKPSEKISSSPYHLPPLFSGDHVMVYLHLNREDVSMAKIIEGTLKGKNGKKDFSQKITLDLSTATKPSREELVLTKLYGRSVIDSLQSGRSYLHLPDGKLADSNSDIAASIEKISLSTGVLSQYTSFIAVDDQADTTSDQATNLVEISSSSITLARRSPTSSSSDCDEEDECEGNSLFDQNDALESIGATLRTLSQTIQTQSMKLECCDMLEEIEMPKKRQSAKPSFMPAAKSKSQSIDGSFEESVVSYLKGMSVSQIKANKLFGSHFVLFLTAVVLAYLEAKMQDSKGVWSLAQRKAKNWLKKESAAKGMDLVKMTEEAQSVVSKSYQLKTEELQRVNILEVDKSLVARSLVGTSKKMESPNSASESFPTNPQNIMTHSLSGQTTNSFDARSSFGSVGSAVSSDIDFDDLLSIKPSKIAATNSTGSFDVLGINEVFGLSSSVDIPPSTAVTDHLSPQNRSRSKTLEGRSSHNPIFSFEDDNVPAATGQPVEKIKNRKKSKSFLKKKETNSASEGEGPVPNLMDSDVEETTPAPMKRRESFMDKMRSFNTEMKSKKITAAHTNSWNHSKKAGTTTSPQSNGQAFTSEHQSSRTTDYYSLPSHWTAADTDPSTLDSQEELSKLDESATQWVQKLKKATKSRLFTLINNTSRSILSQQSGNETKGKWRRKPPNLISYSTSCQFGVEGKVSPEGTVSFSVDGATSNLVLWWTENHETGIPLCGFTMSEDLKRVIAVQLDLRYNDRFCDMKFEFTDPSSGPSTISRRSSTASMDNAARLSRSSSTSSLGSASVTGSESLPPATPPENTYISESPCSFTSPSSVLSPPNGEHTPRGRASLSNDPPSTPLSSELKNMDMKGFKVSTYDASVGGKDSDSSDEEEEEEENRKKALFRGIKFQEATEQAAPADAETLKNATAFLRMASPGAVAAPTRRRAVKISSPAETRTSTTPPKPTIASPLNTKTNVVTKNTPPPSQSTDFDSDRDPEDSDKDKTLLKTDQEVNQLSKQLMSNALKLLEAGNFVEALKNVDKTLQLLVSHQNPREKQMEVKFSVLYKHALNFLIARSEIQDPTEIASLTRNLADVLLPKPRHRIICIRMAIKANGDVSNFGIAARFIQVLLPHNLVDHSKLEAMYAHCKAKDFVDASCKERQCPQCERSNPGGQVDCSHCHCPLNTVCYKKLTPITSSTLYRCDYCDAVLCKEVGEKEIKCCICGIGNLNERPISTHSE
ncbi:hypothetical protein PROFUN_12480 [Planoprotostelium fungivorum]|uniref:VWFA domain-containing protein n=1 Tax=Planoprotostelium fungivorum TaxID=1890364 RepID=A0A2P6N7E1_9EUKA|nr:hypothetical protein PROFUN_12480 [Planoprotostelium fungivorum]